MGLFRKRTIFHAEEAMPDPEELKLRFRRRVLAFTFLAFAIVLGIPVARDIRDELRARLETRRLAERIMETRTLATTNRVPVTLGLDPSGQTWQRTFHARGGDCSSIVDGPLESWSSEGLTWKIQVQQESGETLAGRSLCLHPEQGLLVDTLPVQEGKLLVTAQPRQENGESAGRPAFLLVTRSGAELQTISQ